MEKSGRADPWRYERKRQHQADQASGAGAHEVEAEHAPDRSAHRAAARRIANQHRQARTHRQGRNDDQNERNDQQEAAGIAADGAENQ
jgi:hypothetical protein